MDLSNLTLEEALQKGIITKGRWNDPEWEVDEPEWRNALKFAKKYHTEGGSTYIDKSVDIRSGKETPYIRFIQELLNILINEAHFVDDELLTIAALYNILSLTACETKTLEQKFDQEVVDSVKQLQMENKLTFGEQLEYLATMESPDGSRLTCIFLAVKLLKERVTDLCPLDSWEKDIPYYEHMGIELEQYGMKTYRDKKWNRAIFLGTKILEQIERNKKYSRNCNNTAEE